MSNFQHVTVRLSNSQAALFAAVLTPRNFSLSTAQTLQVADEFLDWLEEKQRG